jgi:hypothetical protein
MAQKKEVLQNWVTIVTASAGGVYQGSPSWMDVSDVLECKVTVEIASISGAGTMLEIQTAVTPDAMWFRVADFMTVGVFSFVASSNDLLGYSVDGALGGMAAYLRWFVAGSEPGFSCCFRITVEY